MSYAQVSEAWKSKLPTLLIDCRSGNVVMRLGNGELLEGELVGLSPADRAAISSAILACNLKPATRKPPFALGLEAWDSSGGDA